MPNGDGCALRIDNITGILHATEAHVGVAALPIMSHPSDRTLSASCPTSKVRPATCISSIAMP